MILRLSLLSNLYNDWFELILLIYISLVYSKIPINQFHTFHLKYQNSEYILNSSLILIIIMDCIRFWTVIFGCGFILFVMKHHLIVVVFVPYTEILD